MSLPQCSRRRIGPAVTMTLAILGSLALLATFVFQVVTASPSTTAQVPARVFSLIEGATLNTATDETSGELRPETITILERTDEGVLAVAFLTDEDAIGAGIFPGKGASIGLSIPGKQAIWVQAMIPGDESTSDYTLSVRRVGNGDTFDHTFTAK